MRPVVGILILLLLPVWTSGTGTEADTPRAAIVGSVFDYVVRDGDTLARISARFGVDARPIRRMNQLGPAARLEPGTSITIDNRHIAIVPAGVRILINVPQRMLFLADDDRVTGYPVGLGQQDWPTRVGPFTVTKLETNPVWDVPASLQAEMKREGRPVIEHMPPGPENPLGAHWIGLSLPNFGIHGTIAPLSVYRFASHGCIRMHPDDVAEVFSNVTVGAPGAIVYAPVVAAVFEGRVFLEAHPDVYKRASDAEQILRDAAWSDGFSTRVDWARASRVLADRDGIAVDVTSPD